MEQEQYQKHLVLYEQILLSALLRQFPVSEADRRTLEHLKQAFHLQDSDTKTLESQLADQLFPQLAEQLLPEENFPPLRTAPEPFPEPWESPPSPSIFSLPEIPLTYPPFPTPDIPQPPPSSDETPLTNKNLSESQRALLKHLLSATSHISEQTIQTSSSGEPGIETPDLLGIQAPLPFSPSTPEPVSSYSDNEFPSTYPSPPRVIEIPPRPEQPRIIRVLDPIVRFFLQYSPFFFLIIIVAIAIKLNVFPALSLATFLYILFSAKIIPYGREGMIFRLGMYTRTLRTGLNFVVPLLDKVVTLSTREQFLDNEPQSVITRDNVLIKITPILYWKILDIVKALHEVENLESSLRDLVTTVLRSLIGQMYLSEVISSRDVINQRVLREIEHWTLNWGVKVYRVEILDILLPDAVQEALQSERIAEARKRATIAETEGQIEAIRRKARAEAEAQVEASEIKDGILLQQTQRLIEVARLKTEAERSGVKLTWEQLQKVDEAVKSRQADAAAIILNLHQENTAKAMNNSEDKSMQAGGDIFNNSGTINNQGNFNVANVSRDVTNSINQLPEPAQSDKPNIKALLTELQKAIEAEPKLSDEDKVDALDEIKKLVEAAAKPEDEKLKEAVPKAMRNINRVVAGVAQTATGLVTIVGKLSPLILGFFAL